MPFFFNKVFFRFRFFKDKHFFQFPLKKFKLKNRNWKKTKQTTIKKFYLFDILNRFFN
uniref:Uncharacterized protein n=1 Tax=Chlorella vulgaris TaxID=3077 RepID=V9H147_CHLVU|nr:hypothetical protein ChvulCp026 [Chlorella vulgaris]pir/T07214/ hypothetical protein 57b - Chlorella vulgaris chloroplast [Chlorella vulgaris]QSV10832.1 hypothetical protein [Chlorella vulgaris]BAA57861.1 unnamed protein product [Chlorella vulgaris]